MPKKLSLSEAFEVHGYLKDCMPTKFDDPIEFIRDMIGLAKEHNPSGIANTLRVLSDKPITELSPEEKTETLIVGLVENKIVSLMGFVEGFE